MFDSTGFGVHGVLACSDRDATLKRFMPQIRREARVIAERLPRTAAADVDDVQQSGVAGALEAIDEANARGAASTADLVMMRAGREMRGVLRQSQAAAEWLHSRPQYR